MLARTPWTPKPEAKPIKLRVNKDRKRHLVDTVARILKRGEPTVFAYEALCRNTIRANLCLNGWGWQDADDIAGNIVRLALLRIGARRPTYQQGQPEWTQEGVIMFERTRCIRCGGKLPEGHRKFCGPICHKAHHNEKHYHFVIKAMEALDEA